MAHFPVTQIFLSEKHFWENSQSLPIWYCSHFILQIQMGTQKMDLQHILIHIELWGGGCWICALNTNLRTQQIWSALKKREKEKWKKGQHERIKNREVKITLQCTINYSWVFIIKRCFTNTYLTFYNEG